ncbi:unnamed protein product [Brachionus calyciflorus]|uniref:Uncharacterized protein n=1 Tax=Brachionus calyciflorus TaxID=104777 RepID=A0A814BCP7_9BILA|nr:unnamed protein product [Brachionus calyciflorus]
MRLNQYYARYYKRSVKEHECVKLPCGNYICLDCVRLTNPNGDNREIQCKCKKIHFWKVNDENQTVKVAET